MADTFNPEAIMSGLKKPLDKMTVKELKDLAMSGLPQIVGASGLHKDELLAKIKETLGIVEEEGGASPYVQQIRAMKKTVAELKAQKNQLPKNQRSDRERLRRQIHNLKKKTRRLAVV